jgi:hypothetical protein
MKQRKNEIERIKRKIQRAKVSGKRVKEIEKFNELSP